MKYYYRLSCPDCTGEDPEGCFGGGTETSTESFDMPKEAEEAGWEATQHSIWEFEVVEEQGNVVEGYGE